MNDLKDTYKKSWKNIEENHKMGESGAKICENLTSLVDRIMIEIISRHLNNHNPIAIFALGGYGRCELSPFSDIDILFLHKGEDPLINKSLKKSNTNAMGFWI